MSKHFFKGLRLQTILFLSTATLLYSAQLHVTTSGSASNSGTLASPWSFRKAIGSIDHGNPPSLHPGDTIFVHGGTYTSGGNLNSVEISGTASAPIKIMNYNHERATIDGGSDPSKWALFFHSPEARYIWVIGLEIMSSGTDRVSTTSSNQAPSDIGISDGVYTQQTFGILSGLKFINLIIHDVQLGIQSWIEAQGNEIYGCTIYNFGWDGSDRGHGHGIYIQNQTGRKTIVDNIIFDGFSHNVHAYGSADAFVDSMTIRGNICFNAGALSSVTGYSARNILVGRPSQAGLPKSVGDSIIDNQCYYTPTIGGNESGNFGYSQGHDGIKILNNWFTNSPTGTAANLVNCNNTTMTGNTYYGIPVGFSASSFPSNLYASDVPSTGSTSFVRNNKYEPGRANIVVYNWSGSDTVQVDVSSVLSNGNSYAIHNAQNFYGDTTFNGTYSGGSIKIPMRSNRWSVAPPNGWSAPATTFPKFGAFVLIRTSIGPPPPAGTLGATPDTLSFGGGNTSLSWASQNATLASIDQGIGQVALSGTTVAQVSVTKTFTLSLTGAGGTMNFPRTVTVLPPPPAAPVLSWPPTGTTGYGAFVTVVWNASSGATTYRLQVSTDSLFGVALFNDSTITGTSRQVGPLPSNAHFYWRVAAKNISGVSTYSGVWNFFGPVTNQYNVALGWNMLSVPITVDDARKATLYPTATSSAFTFTNSLGYVRKDTLKNGVGYWLRFASGQNISLTGAVRSHDTINVQAGWNMIGSISYPVDTSNIVTIPAGIRTSAYYIFSGAAFVPESVIAPGRAYWVKTNASGKFILTGVAP